MKNLLMVADTEHDANMLYAVGMFVPDPFVYLRVRGREMIVISDLEIDRARRQAAVNIPPRVRRAVRLTSPASTPTPPRSSRRERRPGNGT